jgi:hypothetical protein
MARRTLEAIVGSFSRFLPDPGALPARSTA